MSKLNVLMVPHLDRFRSEESGIKRVIEAYFRHLPAQGVNLVAPGEPYDIKAVHAGTTRDADVAHCHGLYWTADYPAAAWEWRVNEHVVESVRHARRVTVPSAWVGETFARDMRFRPDIVPHGIDWHDWQHNEPCGDYVLWNKNRRGDVCDPRPVIELANRFPKGNFVTTFTPRGLPVPGHVNEIGVIPHDEMKKLVQSAAVYLATTKETFGIGILEAMASGVPVLGYASGGIVDLVQHGINGYLAKPGDLDDLAEGLLYCLRHRKVLGSNGRELAREHTWERACGIVADVYRKAAEPDSATAAVIIPAYNYGDVVGRAIESAVNQSYEKLTEIIVVDDGSPDDGLTHRVVRKWEERDGRVRYVRKHNGGVATARNRGIAESSAKYVCCLDADDAIAPEFVAACVSALESDRSLGIAYTGLYYTTPDGKEGISQWPGECDFDRHLAGHNQIPTCCVFRRQMWERLGGYRQRYAPLGAGEEDAEFWLRAGSAGYGAKKVTDEGLFLYSWQSGRVSGNPRHAVTDWRSWHPFVKDGKHPFASIATPAKFSHPVRQYDEPAVSVIIPVGPGHEQNVINALDSLEAQTFRAWEAIVVDDTKDGELLRVLHAYPYVRLVTTNVAGVPEGPGVARNLGAEIARAPYLLFLDADDTLTPPAIAEMMAAWESEGPGIVYSDYVGKAIVGDVAQLAPDLQRRVYSHNERTGEAVIGYKALPFNCDRAQRQPESDRPYIWCNITSLVPRTWHDDIGGFDENLESWEDVDYWYRMARAGRCFVHVEKELLVYRFSTGARRDTGVRKHAELVNYLKDKYEGGKIMPCSGCGRSRRPAPAPAANRPAGRVAAKSARPQDEDWVLCTYASPNRGQHGVVGGAVFRYPLEGVPMIARGDGYRIRYGYRAGGDRFLVHRRDVELARHLFVEVRDDLAPPEPERKPPASPPSLAVEDEEEGPRAPRPTPVTPFDLQTLPGITADIAQELRDDDVVTADDILALGEEGLRHYNGIGKKRAEMILGAIANFKELQS